MLGSSSVRYCGQRQGFVLHDKFPSAVKREFEIDGEEHSLVFIIIVSPFCAMGRIRPLK